MDGRTGTVIFTVYHIFFAFSIRKSLQGEKTGYARKKITFWLLQLSRFYV